MTKSNKKINIRALWTQWVSSPQFLKTLFICIAFLVFFALSLFFIWKRHTEKTQESPLSLPQKFSSKIEIQKLTETIASVQANLQSLSDRLKSVETTAKSEHTLKIPDQLITLELLRGVLEGLIPLESLREA